MVGSSAVEADSNKSWAHLGCPGQELVWELREHVNGFIGAQVLDCKLCLDGAVGRVGGQVQSQGGSHVHQQQPAADLLDARHVHVPGSDVEGGSSVQADQPLKDDGRGGIHPDLHMMLQCLSHESCY